MILEVNYGEANKNPVVQEYNWKRNKKFIISKMHGF